MRIIISIILIFLSAQSFANDWSYEAKKLYEKYSTLDELDKVLEEEYKYWSPKSKAKLRNGWIKLHGGMAEVKRKNLAIETVRKEEKIRQEKIEKQEQSRKEIQYKVDSCILKIFESEEEWSENNARQLCRMAVIDSTNSLMANCILDRGYKKPSSIYASVFNVCERVALKPSWKDKIKYATPLSEYLNKLK